MKKKKELKNGLTNLVESISADADASPMTGIAPLFYNTRNYMISFQRQLLNELYVEHGIVQTMIDQPVEDAFRGDLKLISKELSDDDIAEIEKQASKFKIIDSLKTAIKWARLFGGGGVIINVRGEDPTKPLDLKRIKEGAEVEFYPADRWELCNSPYTVNPSLDDLTGYMRGLNFDFYGQPIHPTRVLVLRGKEAPSLKRLQLAGWGMSELERLIAPLNKFLKNQNVIYELLDEAKLDVYSMQDYQVSLMAGQEEAIKKRVEYTNLMKSYLNALILDKEDLYEQKSMNFAGLSDLLHEARLDIASALKMPVTKLFGMSSAGFNSGDDDLENYNSMIEREVRGQAKDALITLYSIVSIVTLGASPVDLDIEFPSLRVASEDQIQQKKNMVFARGKELYQLGLLTKGEFFDYLQENEIITQKLKISGSNDYAEESMGAEKGASFNAPSDITLKTGVGEVAQ